MTECPLNALGSTLTLEQENSSSVRTEISCAYGRRCSHHLGCSSLRAPAELAMVNGVAVIGRLAADLQLHYRLSFVSQQIVWFSVLLTGCLPWFGVALAASGGPASCVDSDQVCRIISIAFGFFSGPSSELPSVIEQVVYVGSLLWALLILSLTVIVFVKCVAWLLATLLETSSIHQALLLHRGFQAAQAGQVHPQVTDLNFWRAFLVHAALIMHASAMRFTVGPLAPLASPAEFSNSDRVFVAAIVAPIIFAFVATIAIVGFLESWSSSAHSGNRTSCKFFVPFRSCMRTPARCTPPATQPDSC